MENQNIAQVSLSPIDQVQRDIERTSDKYSFISTRRLLTIAENMGFKVHSVKYPKGKNEHALHSVRLDLPGYEALSQKQERPQLIIQNAHDGTSSLRIMAGVFRLVCSNGLVAGDTALNIRMRHVGLVQEDIEKHLDIAAKATVDLAPKVEHFKAKQLSAAELEHLVRSALVIRAKVAGLSENETRSLVTMQSNIERLDKPVRRDDKGNGLWEVLNRVQEKSLKASGLMYLGDDREYHTLRGVYGIKANTTLNQNLWQLAETLAA